MPAVAWSWACLVEPTASRSLWMLGPIWSASGSRLLDLLIIVKVLLGIMFCL